MAPTLYMIHASPPCRAVLMTAKAIGLTLNEKEMNFFHDEHLRPEFLRLNPQRTIPTFVDDDGFAIWDSHAIMAYIVLKYAKDDALYPSDLRKRAIVNQRLFFESGALFFHSRNIAKSVLIKGDATIDREERRCVVEAYGFLDKFLEGNKWVAGDFVSIADYSLVANVSTNDGFIPVDPDEFPNVIDWLERCESLPGYEVNRKGLREATRMMKVRLERKF